MSSPSSTGTQQQITAQQLAIESQQNQLAQDNQAQGSQLMQPLISQLTALSSNNPTAISTALAPYLTNITQGASQAKGQIMEDIGPGAAQQVALANVDTGTQTQIAQTRNALTQGAPAQLAQLGQGIESFGLSDVGAAISAAGGASSSNAATMQAQSQGKASTLSFLGELAGSAGGALGSVFAPGVGCWIAEVIYGTHDPRTFIVREFLNGPFRRTVFGGIVMWLYCRVGKSVAAKAKHSVVMRWALRPVFDFALRTAISTQVTENTALHAKC